MNGALAGLDGVLIGLRTRDLLQHLLTARSSPVVLLVEDLHWIDGASQEVLGRIVDGEAKLRLLILQRGGRNTSRLGAKVRRDDASSEPLAAGEIRRLVQVRLGVEAPPERSFGWWRRRPRAMRCLLRKS